MCISSRALCVGLFFRFRGERTLSRACAALESHPNHPSYAHLGLKVPTPQNALARGSSLFLFSPSPGIDSLPRRRLQMVRVNLELKFLNIKKAGFEQQIGFVGMLYLVKGGDVWDANL